jgi:peptidoglycan/LPS O-acetylase OafA/YrhL
VPASRLLTGLTVLTEPLRPDQLGDANTLFNTWQRVAGSFGIGLLAALYATQARARGPVFALHLVGVVLAAIAGTGVLAALASPPSATPPGKSAAVIRAPSSLAI